MRKLLFGLFFSTLLILGACGSGEDTNDEEAVVLGDGQARAEDGEAVYRSSSCFSCHGADLEGASGPGLQDVGARLTSDEIRTVIEEGTNVMPGGLVEDPEDLDALVDWLSSQE